MSTPFDHTTQEDFVKEPQAVVEGTDETTYGSMPSDPNFSPLGRNSRVSVSITPTGEEQRKLGNEDREQKNKTDISYKITVESDVVDADLLKRVANAIGGGAGSIDETLAIIYSYELDSTEHFRVARGCRPESAQYSIPEKGKQRISVTFDAKEISKPVTDANKGFTIGTGSYATAKTGAPWTHEDQGAGPFVYNGNTYLYKEFTLNISRVLSPLSPNGEFKKIWNKPVQRSISFDITLFRKDNAVSQDAQDLARNSASMVLKSGTATISFTGAQPQDDVENNDETSTGDLGEPHTFEADAISI